MGKPSSLRQTMISGRALWAMVAAILAVALVFAIFAAAVGASSNATSVATVFGPNVTNSSSNAGLGCEEMFVPSLNATTPLFVCAQTKRPDEGGGQNQVAVFTSDGILGIFSVRNPGYIEECFGATVFASRFSSTIKVAVNCKREDTGNGNDRTPLYFDTGITAYPPYEVARR